MNKLSSEIQDVDRVYLIQSIYETCWHDVSRAEFLETMRSVGIESAEPRDFKRRGVTGRVEISKQLSSPSVSEAEDKNSVSPKPKAPSHSSVVIPESVSLDAARVAASRMKAAMIERVRELGGTDIRPEEFFNELEKVELP